MTIEAEELGPAVGRILLPVFDAIEDWPRRERASRVIKHFPRPSPLPLVANIVVRKDNEGVIVGFDLRSLKYAFKREYLLDGKPLASLRDPHASLRELFASGRGTLGNRLCLLDHTKRLLFRGTDAGEVDVFTPGKWVEDFLNLSEALAGDAQVAMGTIWRSLGYLKGSARETLNE